MVPPGGSHTCKGAWNHCESAQLLSVTDARCEARHLHQIFMGIRMTDIELSYVAGIVDGEGSVMFVKTNFSKFSVPVLSICNTNLALLEWIKFKFGGQIHSRKPRKKGHKVSYELRWYYDGCLNMLSRLVDYLIVKKPQAMLLLSEYKALTPRNGKYTEYLLDKKIALIQRIKELNKRGE